MGSQTARRISTCAMVRIVLISAVAGVTAFFFAPVAVWNSHKPAACSRGEMPSTAKSPDGGSPVQNFVSQLAD